MAAAFHNEQQPEFEPVQIQGSFQPQSESTHITGVRLGMRVSFMRMRQWLAARRFEGLHEPWEPRLPRPHLEQCRNFHLCMARCFHSNVGIAGANGTFCCRKPRGIALIAVVDNNMVSVAKLCGSLGMLP